MRNQQNGKANDKNHHRIVTAVSLLVGLFLYFAFRFSWLGEDMARFSTLYLVLMLTVLGGAVLTELGVRRRRFAFERFFERKADNDKQDAASR